MALIVHQGLVCEWHEGAFLDQAQLGYGLQQLWRLVAGTASWQGPPPLRMACADAAVVTRMLDAAPGTLPWVQLAAVAPASWPSGLDTDRLPALCAVAADRLHFDGLGTFPMDLVCATFLQLTRWEEWTRPDPDAFGCHKEDASLAARQGFRDRPVLDEWACVLRAWLLVAAPTWVPALPVYRVDFSHDIDVLRNYTGLGRIARTVARKLVKERQGLASLDALGEGLRALRDQGQDPCITAFDTLMDFSEAQGGRSTFFFMASRPGPHDDGYAVDSPLFLSLAGRIRQRGHQLGWHPGYQAAQDDEVFAEEFTRIGQALGVARFGARHHFLRWRAGFSWRRLARAGITFDASVGYNYALGFRASTAQAYPAFDLEAGQPLALEVKPLIAMDGPLQRAGTPVATGLSLLARRCAAVRGTLTVLIHTALGVSWALAPLSFAIVLVTALVFAAIHQVLFLALPRVAVIASVLLLALQVTVTGGVYPIELLAAPFAAASPYLPFTYAANAMQALFTVGDVGASSPGIVGLIVFGSLAVSVSAIAMVRVRSVRFTRVATG